MSDGLYQSLVPSHPGVYEVKNGIATTQSITVELDEYIVPGFVDVHIHGAFGIDFMTAGREKMSELADKLVSVGYDSFLATTVTAPAAQILEAVETLPDHPAIAGFHLEGPFISPDYPGAQPPESILSYDQVKNDPTWNKILDHPKLRLVTLAPERPGAIDLIKRLKARGVIVSMGHTAATYAEAEEGFSHGVTHATHTYNAMRGLHHREPGALGAVLTNPQTTAEIIYDRHHVSRPAAQVLLSCKPKDKVVAVSDCTQAYGLPPGSEIEMWGHKATVGDHEVKLAGTNTLAGSASTHLECWQNLAQDFGPETATRLASLNPRNELKLQNQTKNYALVHVTNGLIGATDNLNFN